MLSLRLERRRIEISVAGIQAFVILTQQGVPVDLEIVAVIALTTLAGVVCAFRAFGSVAL